MRDVKLRIPKSDFELEEVARFVENRENQPRYDDLNILASLDNDGMPEPDYRSQRGRLRPNSMRNHYDQIWSGKR